MRHGYFSIDSALWRVRFYGCDAYVVQRATHEPRFMPQYELPPFDRLTMMSEYAFDSACRQAFHNAAKL